MTQLLPDIEAMCVSWLISHPEVQALCDDRVYAEVPEGPTYPFVTLFRISGRPDYPRWLDHAQIQIDAWGDKNALREDVRDLCETAVAAIHELVGAVNLGVITAVEDFIGPRPLADPATSWPRFEAEVIISAHPSPPRETFVLLGTAGETATV